MAERRRGTLLVFTAIVVVLFSLGGFVAFRYHDGKQLLDDAKQAGGIFLETEPLKPEWLRTWLGEHAQPFERVVAVRIGEHARDPVTNAHVRVQAGPWIARLSKVRTLRSLDLRSNGTVTDDDVKSFVATMSPDLEKLDLGRSDISDESLEAIADLSNLKELYLSLTFVTERGIDKLRIRRPDMKIVADPLTRRGLGRVRRNLYPDGDSHVVRGFSISADMTAVEAARVGRIPNPIWIGFFQPVPGDVLATLAQQPNINSVVFGRPFSETELAAFASSQELNKLTVYSKQLNDEHLDALASIASLKTLLLLGEPDPELLRKVREVRSDLDVTFERPDLVGYRFNYRYEP